jgi:large repetitive protein
LKTKSLSDVMRHLVQLAAVAAVLFLAVSAAPAAPCDVKNNAPSFITHDLTANVSTSASYCELCGYGYVTIVISNPYSGAAMTNMTVTENLGSSGLTYDPAAPTPIRYRVNGGPAVAGAAPSLSGGGAVLTWTPAQIPALGNLASAPGQGISAQTIAITFALRRVADPEGLVNANRTIQANLTFGTDSGCTDSPQSVVDTLPLREPIPAVTKTGWNYDANQREGSRSNPVYGNNNDDVIWRIDVNNTGRAGLQDLRFDDVMQANNLVINYACPTAASADAIASNNGVLPGGSPCVAASNSINDFIVTNPFGNMAVSFDGYEVDVVAGGVASIYLVGKITADGSCISSKTNTVSNVQWGCGAEPPAGGITRTSTGRTPNPAVATLYTLYGQRAPLTVSRAITGINTSQPVGSKGMVTITITNNSGGSVKNIRLTDLLPPEYVIDPTYWTGGFVKALQVRGAAFGVNTIAPAYGSYPGMIDQITWTNPAAGTLTSTNPAVPLSNTQPIFTITSTTANPRYPDQVNMLREGDVLTVTFPIVMIKPSFYDKVANLDVRSNVPDPPGTDPANWTTLTNRLTAEFDTFCATQGHLTLTFTDNSPSFPEALDVDVIGTELIFILTNDPAQPLPLTVAVTNNGGHDASNANDKSQYHTYVSFGQGMVVSSAPGSCTVTTNPPPRPVWTIPVTIPATATVYDCTGGRIAPGATVNYAFQVIKNADLNAADDLTFRADTVGEIRLWDGTPLWFPAPTPRPDGVTDHANNYTLDGIRARVIGFNLLKSEYGKCTENNPPPSLPDRLVQIGEDCTFHIDTGGWFGFKTPGFTYIAVQKIQVVDQVPAGQGYISSTDPFASIAPFGSTTSAVKSISLNKGNSLVPPAPQPLDEGWFNWSFNQAVPAERITVKDEWFRVNYVDRIMNNPVNVVAAPNQQAAQSSNILNSYFQTVFFNPVTNMEELYNLGPNTVGYPREVVRRVDLTIQEPKVTIIKEVCNETLYGVGPSCSHFVTLADDGDAYSTYIYRLTLTNEASSSGVPRAPAYDVIVTDTQDPSDLAYAYPFMSDGLDNDGDGFIDAADLDGEGAISDDVVKNGVPAVITISYTNSKALQKIDAGKSVALYYRVKFDDSAAPLQQFVNTANATYDSLLGPSGNQSPPQKPDGDKGGARVYVTPDAHATVKIIPVLTQPKKIVAVSNTPLSGAGSQGVSIGEEVRYELTTSIPVSQLRSFVIRDELPVGIRCAEAPAVNLNAAPYSAAGFMPGGTFTPTCTNNVVQWNFGDQQVTKGTTNNRYDFKVNFIARVENTANTKNGVMVRNGGSSTNVTANYIDQAGQNILLTYGEAAVVVHEPKIALTKAFSVARGDAGDIVTVAVTAANTGTAAAYNLRILDDLAAVKDLTYVAGSTGGTDMPDVVDTATLGVNRPIFRWNTSNPKYAVPPGATWSFTFKVLVGALVQPLEVLINTIQASWQSLPGQTTALNSSGSIGADGSDMGIRNGALPNAGNAINNYETIASASFSVPAVQITKTDLSPAVVPAIGAEKQFQIEIRLPEGVTRNLTVTDNLASAGVSYVLSNNASYDITYEFAGITGINGQTPDEAAFTSFPADNTSTSAIWNIGTVATATEDDVVVNNINPVIRIKYYARANNDLMTHAGSTLQNSVTVNYTNGATGATEALFASTSPVTVVEPKLTLSKNAANVTPGKQPTDAAVGGDILEYHVIAANTGNSTAYDVNVKDTLPSGVVLYPGFVPTATINGVPVSNFIPTPAGAPAGPLIWGQGNGDGSLDIPVGQTLILTYRATVIFANSQIQNGVLADWTSLDGPSPLERTGAGCPNVTPPNIYCVGPVTATTLGLQPVLVFQKTYSNVTPGKQPNASVNPGDTLRYRIMIKNISTVPVGNFSIIDDLDNLNSSPMFVPGTLKLVTVPAGATTLNTSLTGGNKGTGQVDIRNLNITAAGGASDTVIIEFDARLIPVITNGTIVLDQAGLMISGILFQKSNDPSISGSENPTRTVISSAPVLRIQKTAQVLTVDPSGLSAGDTVRYTITVKNTGTENATGVSLRDQIPANTTYVANSTKLNGTAVSDTVPGISPLQNGMLVHAPEDPTPGAMRADATSTTSNIGTVTFDVVVSPYLWNGAAICNQGFVTGSGAGSGPFPEQPTDNPATPAVNDPTCRVVGNMPLLYALKTVAIAVDNGTPGVVLPGDVLRYTITISNSGAIPATNVVFTDSVPQNTTYVANSVKMNGIAVPDNGGSPLAAGLSVSSSDLTPPLPGTGAGTLSAGAAATVIFDVRVNAGVPSGTIISNQGSVTSSQLPTLLTDSDGNPSNGYQPTVVVVGNGQQLTITKQVSVVGGGTADVGSELEYVVQVTNIGAVPATNVIINDVLPSQLAYVTGSGSLNGSSAGITVSGSTITANYSSFYGNLPSNGTIVLRFYATIASGALGTTITNTAQVTWNTPSQSASASASVDIGGTPGSTVMNGRIWHDANFNNTLDSGEKMLAGWTVQVYRNSQLLGYVLTDVSGAYKVSGLAPTTTAADQYEIRFRAPGATTSTALLGRADSAFTNGLQRISGITAASGSNLQNLNLPIDPNGVVYNSLLRTPIAGATVTMLRASTKGVLPSGCFDDPAQQNQMTLTTGYYKFDMNFSDPSCPSGADYLIQVTPPSSGYGSMPSRIIPPTTSDATASFSVPGCPGTVNDAIPATLTYCEAQPSEFAPATSVAAGSAGTKYYLHFTLSNAGVGSAQLFDNHIPADPPLNTAVSITKTASISIVTRGQMVPYTITFKNTLGAPFPSVTIIDTFPPGFKYVSGSARYDGKPLEPTMTTRDIRFLNISLTSTDQHVIRLLLLPGTGVREGNYVNSAQVLNGTTGEAVSGVATATIRIVPDPTLDCTDIIGKVFDDVNANGYPDPGEKGLAGVRIVSARGLIATTDKYGRFHITCAAMPNEDRGSNFILKLDDRTLPTGYRVTTENPLVRRVTRGKAIKFNFGAALHRVVRLDLADGAFELGTTEIRQQWKPRIEMLLAEMRKAPSILRISYLGDVEDAAVVKARTEAVKREIADRWEQGSYELRIETEIFWRRGGPPDRRPVQNYGQ